MTKNCPQCKLTRDIKCFPRDKKAKDGHYSWCFDCCSKKRKEYYLKDPQKYIKKTSEYAKKTKYLYTQRWQKAHRSVTKYRNLRSKCKRNNIEVLSEKDFLSWFESQELKCSYCDVLESSLVNSKYHPKGKTGQNLGIDRLDPSKGYIKENIVLACMICNFIKGNVLNYQETREIAQKYIKPKLNQLNKLTKTK